MLISGFFVFFMQAGFAMLCAGSVRSKNVMNILIKNVLDACIGCIAYFCFGYAISYGLGQGATMVAAFWGVFIWKEFKDAPEGTNSLIMAMFALFFIGLGLIIFSR